jgi:hypothetical protein
VELHARELRRRDHRLLLAGRGVQRGGPIPTTDSRPLSLSARLLFSAVQVSEIPPLFPACPAVAAVAALAAVVAAVVGSAVAAVAALAAVVAAVVGSAVAAVAALAAVFAAVVGAAVAAVAALASVVAAGVGAAVAPSAVGDKRSTYEGDCALMATLVQHHFPSRHSYHAFPN